MAETKQLGHRLPLDLWRKLNRLTARYEIHRANGRVSQLTAAMMAKALLTAAATDRLPVVVLVEEILPKGARIVQKEAL